TAQQRRQGVYSPSLRLRVEQLRPVPVRFLPTRTLDLDPARARPRPVGRILFLAHDALEAEARTFREQDAGILEAVAVPEQIALGVRQQSLEPRTPLLERLSAEIAPVERHDIEGIDAHGHVRAVQQG